ncbi:MAG TPA: hypothetical protein VGR96_04795 [Acidobacteriaceae bacterium]|nr:hypothetical protein [Acidobacteriaceae bacterium]
MSRLGTHERLRRAADLLAAADNQAADTPALLEAWEYLKGLRNDDFPAEMHAAFTFLQHEISRAQTEDLSNREVVFLTEKIRRLEIMWLDASHHSQDAPA